MKWRPDALPCYASRKSGINDLFRLPKLCLRATKDEWGDFSWARSSVPTLLLCGFLQIADLRDLKSAGGGVGMIPG